MRERILRRFPAGAHPLVLASDPDGLLEDDDVRQALAGRGYRLVCEGDPFRTWAAAEALRPWTLAEPVLIVTRGPLEALPYDLWEEGHRVELSLADEFAGYSLPLVRELTPAQRRALAAAPPPERRLNRRATAEVILREVFGAALRSLADPGALLLWLSGVHEGTGPLPPAIQRALLDDLAGQPAYRGWPLADVLSDAQAYRAFVQQAWERHVRGSASIRRMVDGQASYAAAFDGERLQAALGALVERGLLCPVLVENPAAFPLWARPGLAKDEAAGLLRRLEEVLEAASAPLGGAEDWEAVGRLARAWAQAALAGQAGADLPEEARVRYCDAERAVDARFGAWLQAAYTALAGRRLPEPHHVHHVPGFLAYRWRQRGATGRVALLVLDGLSLADWQVIGPAWRERHPAWALEERLLLAQVPTVTAISRQALVTGRPPADLESLTSGAAEAAGWRAFWQGEDFAEEVVRYERLALARQEASAEVLEARFAAGCLVDSSIDDLVHGSTLGAAQLQGSLRRWLDDYSPALEALIDRLLGAGVSVTIASDHGHVEASGIGRPNEGILADARALRCRVYSDGAQAQRTADTFPPSIVWADDGLLPAGVTAVMPARREAYTNHGAKVVAHGGVTIEEMVVPLVTIDGERARC